GINTRLVTGWVLAAGSALAAVGGVIGAPILGIRPGLEWEVMILALIVIVIGGQGSVKGVLVGALLIGQVESLGVALAPELSAFALFGTMAVVLLVRPEGIFGRAGATS
ncbi:MAG: branched-chain amino acid ABC transporter permease, partial [Actinomycetota bacterium]|nr:branched-chain amino acid ABC transporter permease [Actinomycetota bacterium]